MADHFQLVPLFPWPNPSSVRLSSLSPLPDPSNSVIVVGEQEPEPSLPSLLPPTSSLKIDQLLSKSNPTTPYPTSIYLFLQTSLTSSPSSPLQDLPQSLIYSRSNSDDSIGDENLEELLWADYWSFQDLEVLTLLFSTGASILQVVDPWSTPLESVKRGRIGNVRPWTGATPKRRICGYWVACMDTRYASHLLSRLQPPHLRRQEGDQGIDRTASKHS